MANLVVEELQIASGFVPVDMQSGANDGDWVSMEDYDRLAVVFFKAAGTAGDDPTLTIKQATDNSGSGAKALDFTTIWTKQGTLTGIGQWTENTQSASNTYTDTDAAENQAIWVVEFEAEDLDADNDFSHVQGSVADVGSNAQLGCLLYLLASPTYAEAPDSMLSALG